MVTLFLYFANYAYAFFNSSFPVQPSFMPSTVRKFERNYATDLESGSQILVMMKELTLERVSRVEQHVKKV